MKKLLCVTSLVSTLAFSATPQQDGAFGVGVMLGEPTGFSTKYNLDSVQSVDVGLGWSFTDNGKFHIHADYLRHERGLFKIDSASFDLHWGLGARMKMREDDNTKKSEDTDTKFGVRAPVGIDYSFQGVPIEVFLEAALVFDFVPATEADFSAALGGRWFF